MALKINNATFGYDVNEVEAALKSINAEVIQKSVDKMNGSMQELREWVDAAWRGKSAEQFKKNMETDKNLIVNELDASYKSLTNVIKEQIGGRIVEADENLVKAREE